MFCHEEMEYLIFHLVDLDSRTVYGRLSGRNGLNYFPFLAGPTEEGRECEDDKCETLYSLNSTGVCVDSPLSDTGCDTDYSRDIGIYSCETYSCGEE